MSTRSGSKLDLHVGCGSPLSPAGLVPRTPLSPSAYLPKPSEFNLDSSMFVAGLRREYQDGFHQAVAEAMNVYANQVSRLEATWPQSSTRLDVTWPQSSAVAAGSSAAVPFFVGDDLLG